MVLSLEGALTSCYMPPQIDTAQLASFIENIDRDASRLDDRPNAEGFDCSLQMMPCQQTGDGTQQLDDMFQPCNMAFAQNLPVAGGMAFDLAPHRMQQHGLG